MSLINYSLAYASQEVSIPGGLSLPFMEMIYHVPPPKKNTSSALPFSKLGSTTQFPDIILLFSKDKELYPYKDSPIIRVWDSSWSSYSCSVKSYSLVSYPNAPPPPERCSNSSVAFPWHLWLWGHHPLTSMSVSSFKRIIVLSFLLFNVKSLCFL